MKRVFLLVFLAGSMCCAGAADGRLPLVGNWQIQSSADVREGGAVISTAAYRPSNWYPAAVPGTVLSALVADKVYPDPYFGMNLRSFPGTSYPIGFMFANLQMPPESPFRHAWWYRTKFQVPAGYAGKTVWLRFDGINFRANVWLNGTRIAAAEKMAGAWRLFEFNVTSAVHAGAENALAVEVFPPQPTDLAITFVDWNPMPPDKGMGLWRDVYLTATGPVAIRFPQVITHLNPPALDQAKLTVTAEVHNAAAQPVSGVLRGRIEQLEFSQVVSLGPNETRIVTFPERTLANPRLWWPYQVGPQNLYPLTLEFETGGQVSDRAAIKFGVREVTSEVDSAGHLLFHINGKNILIRGAGYTFDMLLRSSPERQKAELDYVRDMNLNTVRLEGKLEDEHFFELCDQYGILVMSGWCCCDHWEKWKDWDQEDHVIAAESLKDQIRRLRSHPSAFDWMNGSDGPPPPDVEKMYIGILKEYNWPNPYQSSATEKRTSVTGDTGVKMRGPYDYVAPSYWYLDKKLGGAYGFNTETGPGPAVPPIESLREMLPEDRLWPINSFWDYHAGGGAFRNIKVFTTALTERYGVAANVEDYAKKAQVLAYESHRAMFEAFGRNKYTSTGVIQWMLNNSWPGMIWHLYDYYLRPGGSYFGAKKACEPLHVQYSYDDRSVVVVNSRYERVAGLRVSAKVYNLDMTEKSSQEATVDAGPDSSTRVLAIPELTGLTGAYFVALGLRDSTGKQVSSNFYWLSTKPETLDWEHSNWYLTPTESYADMTALQTLPGADLRVKSSFSAGTARVTIENPGRTLAFFVHLKVVRSNDGDEVLPVLWQDNYFPVFPGETREVSAAYSQKLVAGAKPAIEVDGWNVPRRRSE